MIDPLVRYSHPGQSCPFWLVRGESLKQGWAWNLLCKSSDKLKFVDGWCATLCASDSNQEDNTGDGAAQSPKVIFVVNLTCPVLGRSALLEAL